jgi:hypothetical protein
MNVHDDPLYPRWRGMLQRCGHTKGGHAHDTKHYAERGIVVCDQWRASFHAFKYWAYASGYKRGLILDRRHNHLGYGPHNCRWVTLVESNRNKRTTMGDETRGRMREAYLFGARQRDLARAFGYSEATVSLLVHGGHRRVVAYC